MQRWSIPSARRFSPCNRRLELAADYARQMRVCRRRRQRRDAGGAFEPSVCSADSGNWRLERRRRHPGVVAVLHCVDGRHAGQTYGHRLWNCWFWVLFSICLPFFFSNFPYLVLCNI